MKTCFAALLMGASIVVVPGGVSGAPPAETPLKQHSAFYRPERIAQIRTNLVALPNGEELRKQALARAGYWLRLSDEDVWNLMFGPGITRSWMVWSDGKCPACTNDVVMYQWIIDAQKHPWKTQCPRCREYFPKNDFGAFYKSGLNPAGVFDPKLADRKLLFNTEHPGESDPLRSFGVDDGEGFVKDGKRWRFIGAYLVYGQFKQLVQGGIKSLAEAWVLTGDTNCARKAGILLDRVADLYPDFAYGKQALVYEKQGPDGYVSVWHDACEETREMVLAYDQVFECIRNEPGLVMFLSEQARKHGFQNTKTNFAEVQRNIESRILRDALNSPAKMHSNFPRMEIAYTTIRAVLGWPENRAEVESEMDKYIAQATAVDGVTGEKGLAGYTSYTINGLAGLLGEFSRSEPKFLTNFLTRLPSLRQTWRFHIDTMCLDRFYPNSGDSGLFGKPFDHYVGASFVKLNTPNLLPSMFTFFWQLYEATGDPAYVQVLYRENGDSVEGLPHDLCAPDPENIRQGTKKVIEKEGPRPVLASAHKPGWHIGILRSGRGEKARALCMDYDAGGAHGHLDAMNIGLFARGMDLLPDFGYPPVQHGGWSTPEVAWYLSPAAHNTVTVDGQAQRTGAGQCTLWADGERFHIMRASAPALIDIQQFERTVALVDVSEERFYAIDLFRVRSGSEHTKFLHGPRADFAASGLRLSMTQPYGRGALMRNFMADTNAAPGWHADWTIPAQTNSQPTILRYTDLTEGASGMTAEANVMPYNDKSPKGFWIPSVLVRRTGAAPLSTVFAGTLEAFEAEPTIASAQRLKVHHDEGACTNGCVATAMALLDGRTDLVFAAARQDEARPMRIQFGGRKASFTGDTCLLRCAKGGTPESVVFVKGSSLNFGDLHLVANPATALVELNVTGGKLEFIRGTPRDAKLVSR